MIQKRQSRNEQSKNNIRWLKVIAGAIKAAWVIHQARVGGGGVRVAGRGRLLSVDGTAPGPPLANIMVFRSIPRAE